MLLDIVGKRFGRWKVTSLHGVSKNKMSTWLCICDCGTERVVRGANLKNGTSKSCGCLHAEITAARERKHGEAWKTPEYAIWQAMIQRCTNPNAATWNYYGGRGICVCDRWRNSFENFIADMGRRPSSAHTLDRVENNKGYDKDNCAWRTRKDQMNNTRKNRFIDINGDKRTVSQWAEHMNVDTRLIDGRLRRGWSGCDAVMTPIDIRYDKNKGKKRAS
jgi:hypothetical protein